MDTITQAKHANRNVFVLLTLASLHFVFHLCISDYLGPALRDLTSLLIVAAILIPGIQLHHQAQRHPLPKCLLFTVGACMLMALVTNYYGEWVAAEPVSEVSEALTAEAPLSSYFLAKDFLLTPIQEEIVFRLGFLGALATLVGRFPALILSSLLFAVSHLTHIEPIGLPPYCFSGLMFGVTYFIFGLRWSVVGHVGSNALAHSIEVGLYGSLLEEKISFFLFLSLVMSGFWVLFQQITRHRRMIVGGRQV